MRRGGVQQRIQLPLLHRPVIPATRGDAQRQTRAGAAAYRTAETQDRRRVERVLARLQPVRLAGVAAVQPYDLDSAVRAGQRPVDLRRLADRRDMLLKCGDARYNSIHGPGPFLFGLS